MYKNPSLSLAHFEPHYKIEYPSELITSSQHKFQKKTPLDYVVTIANKSHRDSGAGRNRQLVKELGVPLPSFTC